MGSAICFGIQLHLELQSSIYVSWANFNRLVHYYLKAIVLDIPNESTMPSRPPVLPYNSSSSSSQLHQNHSNPTHRLYPLFAQLSFHIVTAKIDEDLSRVYQCVDALGGKCVGPEQARFLITALKGRARLLRAIGEDLVVSFTKYALRLMPNGSHRH